jgi:hypothetical protein
MLDLCTYCPESIAHITSMAKVVLEKPLVEVPIAMEPSRLEVLSGLHVRYFWQVHNLDIALASGTLHWCRRGCFIVGV